MWWILLLSALFGCTKAPESVNQVNSEFRVETLFTHEGCTVYRFYDGGEERYYTNCQGQTIVEQSYQCGKMRCRRIENINTSIKN